jgi:hypothetical protein
MKKTVAEAVAENAKKLGSSTQIIKPANMQLATFNITGNAPLVIHRFSVKSQNQMEDKMKLGPTSKKGKARDALDPKQIYQDAKYVGPGGWEGFNGMSIRHALVSACRLVGYKMTLAKMSIFFVQDGWDKYEPHIPLIKINGKSEMLRCWARVETGGAYLTYRPAYYKWTSKITLRFDADQFSANDVANLLVRAGIQVGIGEGRPDSKNGVGMGWGTFTVDGKKTKA